MSVNLLREAFDSVANPRFTALMAFMETQRASGVEYSKLRFRVIDDAGTESEVFSERVPPGGDVIEAARQTARNLLEANPPAPPPEPMP